MKYLMVQTLGDLEFYLKETGTATHTHTHTHTEDNTTKKKKAA